MKKDLIAAIGDLSNQEWVSNPKELERRYIASFEECVCLKTVAVFSSLNERLCHIHLGLSDGDSLAFDFERYADQARLVLELKKSEFESAQFRDWWLPISLDILMIGLLGKMDNLISSLAESIDPDNRSALMEPVIPIEAFPLIPLILDEFRLSSKFETSKLKTEIRSTKSRPAHALLDAFECYETCDGEGLTLAVAKLAEAEAKKIRLVFAKAHEDRPKRQKRPIGLINARMPNLLWLLGKRKLNSMPNLPFSVSPFLITRESLGME